MECPPSIWMHGAVELSPSLPPPASAPVIISPEPGNNYATCQRHCVDTAVMFPWTSGPCMSNFVSFIVYLSVYTSREMYLSDMYRWLVHFLPCTFPRSDKCHEGSCELVFHTTLPWRNPGRHSGRTLDDRFVLLKCCLELHFSSTYWIVTRDQLLHYIVTNKKSSGHVKNRFTRVPLQMTNNIPVTLFNKKRGDEGREATPH